jgi:hypothetical protein
LNLQRCSKLQRFSKGFEPGIFCPVVGLNDHYAAPPGQGAIELVNWN